MGPHNLALACILRAQQSYSFVSGSDFSRSVKTLGRKRLGKVRCFAVSFHAFSAPLSISPSPRHIGFESESISTFGKAFRRRCYDSVYTRLFVLKSFERRLLASVLLLLTLSLCLSQERSLRPSQPSLPSTSSSWITTSSRALCQPLTAV